MKYAVNDSPVWPFTIKDTATGLVKDITIWTIIALLERDDGTVVEIVSTAVDEANGAGSFVVEAGDLTGRIVRVDMEVDNTVEVLTTVGMFELLLGTNLGGT